MNVIILLETGKGIFSFRTCDSLVRYDIREEKFCVVGGCKAENGYLGRW